MTGKLTPRLGLMAPVNADVFTPDDFTDTFTKLDNAPGVIMIDNGNQLPTGLTNAQHGSLYLQRDIRAVWMWNQPTTGSTGGWTRANNVGLCATAGMPAPISWTGDNPGVRFLSATCTAPGGRWLGIKVHIPLIFCTSPYGFAIANINVNNGYLTRAHLPTASTVGFGTLEGWVNFPAGSVVTVEAWIHSYISGTVTIGEAWMNIWEV